MDEIDREILEILKENGRASYTDISERVDVTEATVRNRVQRMKDEGVIDGFTVKTSRSGQITAFVTVRLDENADPEEVYDKFPEADIYEIAGKEDGIVRIGGSNPREINHSVDRIRSIQGVQDTETHMVLRKR